MAVLRAFRPCAVDLLHEVVLQRIDQAVDRLGLVLGVGQLEDTGSAVDDKLRRGQLRSDSRLRLLRRSEVQTGRNLASERRSRRAIAELDPPARVQRG